MPAMTTNDCQEKPWSLKEKLQIASLAVKANLHLQIHVKAGIELKVY